MGNLFATTEQKTETNSQLTAESIPEQCESDSSYEVAKRRMRMKNKRKRYLRYRKKRRVNEQH